MAPLRIALVALLVGGCTFKGDVLIPPPPPGSDGGRDAGRPRFDAGPPFPWADAGPRGSCSPGTPDPWEPVPPPPVPHVVDGQFTGTEWSAAPVLQGLYGDVYLDARDGFLYLLLDWRVNTLGPCGGTFRLNVNGISFEVTFLTSGEVLVTGAPLPAVGALGFGPSPVEPQAHALYELRIPLPDGAVHVCPTAPRTGVLCEDAVAEVMVFSLESVGGEVRVFRSSAFELGRLPLGAACGAQEGVCDERLLCVMGRCQDPASIPDAGPDAGADDPDAGPMGPG